MRILTGKHAGGGYRPHQWANDWITADNGRDRRNIVVRPTNVQLEGDEYWTLRADYIAFWQRGDRHAGMFWQMWKLETDGTFTPRPNVAAAFLRGYTGRARHGLSDL